MKLFALLFGVSIVLSTQASEFDKQLSKKEYVDLWRATAVQQMIQYKIPASITLAQGILESGSGNSELVKNGNNHFGIKCHDWTGKTMFIDDDKKGECFRVYKNGEESFVDHSEFLKGRSRYSKLFTFETTDYKAWSKGLKEAGYATNPKYPDLLIGIIEELKLNELDNLGVPTSQEAPNLALTNEKLNESKHSVVQHENKVKYIVAKKGDTFYRISKEFGLGLWQLYKYNDFGTRKDVLEEGDIIYIQPKIKRSKTKTIVLTEKMSLRELSQAQGLKLEHLLKRNDTSSADQILPAGEKVTLR